MYGILPVDLSKAIGCLLLSHVREQCRKQNGALKTVVTMYY